MILPEVMSLFLKKMVFSSFSIIFLSSGKFQSVLMKLIIQILPSDEKRQRIPDREFFHSFVRAMFFHRRKLLRSELLGAFKKQLDKAAVDAILQRQGLAPTSRAEELEVDAMLALCEAVRTRTGES